MIRCKFVDAKAAGLVLELFQIFQRFRWQVYWVYSQKTVDTSIPIQEIETTLHARKL